MALLLTILFDVAHVITFVIPEESHVMEKIEKETGVVLERSQLPGMDYNRQKGYHKAMKLQQQRMQQQHHFNAHNKATERSPRSPAGKQLLGSKQKNQPQKQGPKQFKKKDSKKGHQKTPERGWGGGGGGGGSGGRSRQQQHYTRSSPTARGGGGGGDNWRRAGDQRG